LPRAIKLGSESFELLRTVLHMHVYTGPHTHNDLQSSVSFLVPPYTLVTPQPLPEPRGARVAKLSRPTRSPKPRGTSLANRPEHLANRVIQAICAPKGSRGIYYVCNKSLKSLFCNLFPYPGPLPGKKSLPSCDCWGKERREKNGRPGKIHMTKLVTQGNKNNKKNVPHIIKQHRC
jgi:hypothetical protein